MWEAVRVTTGGVGGDDSDSYLSAEHSLVPAPLATW